MRLAAKVCSVIVSLISVTAALGQPIGDISSQFIYSDDARAAAAQIAGNGVALESRVKALSAGATPSRFRDADGAEITWHVVRDVRDPQGLRHVFYRQVLNTPDNGAVELFGSEVGVHYGPDDAVAHIAGRQFTSVTVANSIRFPAAEAHRRAVERFTLPTSTASKSRAYDALPMEMRLYRDRYSTLALFSRDGERFRYVYRTLAGDATGATFEVSLDAETGEIVAAESADRNSNCAPSQPVQVTWADGYPIRPGIAIRTLQANHAPDRSGGFMYEGVVSYSLPRKLVFQEVPVGSPFQCVLPPTTRYTLFPLSLGNGPYPVPTYIDDRDGIWAGNTAGDALYRTIQTMNVFASMGRNGWDGMGGDAQIVVRSTANPLDTCSDSCASFFPNGSGEGKVPVGAVAINAGTQLYPSAAALDQVAHEWGHGVISKTSQLVNLQLNEGFADVIGQIVEKRAEPGDPYGVGGPELNNDWDLGEDLAPTWGCAGCYFFSGSRDDVNGHSFGGWTNNYFNNRLHIDDAPPTPEAPAAAHDVGNMLNVTLRLLSDGGLNPICTRLWWASGCNVFVTGVGVEKASRIMFDTIQFYLPSNAQWVDLATYANTAAFARYSNCHPVPWSREPNPTPYDASAEQDAVNKAFGAIGYPRLTPPTGCS